MEKIINALADNWPALLIYLIGGSFFVGYLRRDIIYLAARTENLEVKIEKLVDVASRQAAQDAKIAAQAERQNMLDKRVDELMNDLRELRRGDGFILPFGRGAHER